MTKIVGILNVTPDSFADKGEYLDPKKALLHAKNMQAQGADIIDIGAESSRPGATPLSLEAELDRLLPVLKVLHQNIDIPLSIDTYKPKVMQIAKEYGISMLNDIKGFTDPEALKVAADSNLPIVIMHMQGEPLTMQKNYAYTNLFGEIKDFFIQRINAAVAAGVAKHNIILDPGFGFGKSVAQNLTLIKLIAHFKQLGHKIYIGLSRKSTIGTLCNIKAPADRDNASTALHTIAMLNGADYIRVHNVIAVHQARAIVNSYQTVTTD